MLEDSEKCLCDEEVFQRRKKMKWAIIIKKIQKKFNKSNWVLNIIFEFI